MARKPTPWQSEHKHSVSSKTHSTTAAHATSQGSQTHLEETRNYPLLYTWVHRCTCMVSVTQTEKIKSNTILSIKRTRVNYVLLTSGNECLRPVKDSISQYRKDFFCVLLTHTSIKSVNTMFFQAEVAFKAGSKNIAKYQWHDFVLS